MRVRNGVIPFVESYFQVHSKSWLQTQTLDSFGATVFASSSPTLHSVGIYGPPYCPIETAHCMHFYFIQTIPSYSTLPDFPGPRRNLNDLKIITKPLFVKLFNVPFYDIHLSTNKGSTVSLEHCRGYGYELQPLVLCARNILSETNQTSLFIGTYHSQI